MPGIRREHSPLGGPLGEGPGALEEGPGASMEGRCPATHTKMHMVYGLQKRKVLDMIIIIGMVEYNKGKGASYKVLARTTREKKLNGEMVPYCGNVLRQRFVTTVVEGVLRRRVSHKRC